MKKLAAMMLLAVLAFTLVPACAQEAGMIAACGIVVSSNAVEIDFGDVLVTDVDALTAMLDEMPQLKRVDMFKSRLEHEEMDMLFNRYPQITFGWTYRVGDHTVRTDMTAFSTLHGSSPKPAHTEKDFKWLKFCKNLQAIDVGHNWVVDISWLTNFPELKVLILGVNRVEDLSPLAQLTELEYLELFSNRFTNLTPLTGLTKLRDLNIKNNPVTDISPLFEMPWLERLWLGMGKMKNINGQTKKALQEAMPACEMNWVSMPTAGTWREHPHYDTIHEMFTKQVYIPFDD